MALPKKGKNNPKTYIPRFNTINLIFQDMGCGVGGPARSIAQICECKITGININDYQLSRARHLTEKAGLSHLCQFQTVSNRTSHVKDHSKLLFEDSLTESD